jgi:hypothetical protein
MGCWMDGLLDGLLDGRVDGWVDGWVDGRMDGRKERRGGYFFACLTVFDLDDKEEITEVPTLRRFAFEKIALVAIFFNISTQAVI